VLGHDPPKETWEIIQAGFRWPNALSDPQLTA